MAITSYLYQFIVAIIVFLVVDLLWLGVIAKDLYAKYIGDFLRTPPNWAAAIVFYILFVIGLIIFAIAPAIREGSLSKAIIYGALFGFFTYMTYELTNYAVIKNWPLDIVIIDIVWGVVLATTVAAVTYLVVS